MDNKTMIARRIAKELKDGEYVNLGFGIPTLVADNIPPGVNIVIHTENGAIGLGSKVPEGQDRDMSVVGPDGWPVTLVSGAATFDSAMSFAIIRGGHLDVAILGALQVDQEGNLANWMIPGKIVPGMGGAMDLAVGAKKVFIVMEHTEKSGKSKLLKRCTLPLTSVGCVNMIVTNLGVFYKEPEGLVLKETAPGVTVDEIREATEADFTISPDLKVMDIA